MKRWSLQNNIDRDVMQAVICPKCGFRQNGGDECYKCGIIFSRYRTPRTCYEAPGPRAVAGPLPTAKPAGIFRRIYRGLRWAMLAGLICVIILILKPAPPPSIVTPADAAQRAVDKVNRFQSAALRGRQDTLEMDESELNGWLQDNLAIQRSPRIADLARASAGGSPVSLAKRAVTPESAESQEFEQTETSVRDVMIELREDSLLAYVMARLCIHKNQSIPSHPFGAYHRVVLKFPHFDAFFFQDLFQP